MKKTKKEPTAEDLYLQAQEYRRRYAHSGRKLYKSILKCLPPIGSKDNPNMSAVGLTIKAGEIMDFLGEASRAWNISLHWMFTVCNPKINDTANVKYSPIYQQYATNLPLDRFGELDKLVVNERNELVQVGSRLVGDSRFVGTGCEEFGFSWDDNGIVIKRDDQGHPVLDGYSKWVADHINQLQTLCCQNPHRDRHFMAFQICHTRDDEVDQRDGKVEHKESHIHVVVDMPTRRTRYRMMELMGFNFDDFTETFEWINKVADQKNKRIDAFLSTLQGSMRNYVVTKDLVSSLQYLVHQSKKAKRDQKTPYAIDEVISWLPDDPGKSYSSIAGVYDDEQVAEGINAAVIRNLHSPYNLAHHTDRLVGRITGKRVFTYAQLSKLRNLGNKGAGRMTFSQRSKKMILDQLMSWIYSGVMEVTDWKDAVHAAFDDSDALGLIGDKDFIQKLTAVLDDQRESTINDISADRKMTTIFISAAQGGIGKSYLANRLCQYYEQGRTPYMTAAEDKDKTVDYWQDYADQQAAVIDEISPSSVVWNALKDMLDPHKIPRVSSRYHNACPWNVNLMVMTNVYADGVSGYIRDVLHYAPGVGKLGYLEKSGSEWKVKKGDPVAGQIYLSQLSQLLRRIPINIHLAPTENGKGTEVIVSVINFRPGGRSIQNYDYVYDKQSDRVFNTIINEDIAEEDLNKIIKAVVQMIKHLQTKAKQVFDRDPNAILGPDNGFMSRHAYFGLYLKNGIPLLSEEKKTDQSDSGYTGASTPNLLTQLSKLKYELWNEVDEGKTNFRPNLNQLTALMRGYLVPIRHVYGAGEDNNWVIIKLSDKAVRMIKNHETTKLIDHLNSTTSFDEHDEFFIFSKSDKVARIFK